MFSINILYFDDCSDHFSEVDFFKFDSLFISFGDYQIPTEDVYRVFVYFQDNLVCQWFNE